MMSNSRGLKPIWACLCFLLIFATSTFACSDNWTTIASGDWTNDAIWSVNGGPAQTGPPADDACITIAHVVNTETTFVLDVTGSINITTTGRLVLDADLEVKGMVDIWGRVQIGNTLKVQGSGSLTIQHGGSLYVMNDLLTEDCGTTLTVYGLVEVDNSLSNKGTVSGSGGVILVGNDAKNDDGCASFSGDISVCDSDGSIDQGSGSISGSVFEAADCSGPLPVTLVEFSVTEGDGLDHIYWETAAEVNCAGFRVEVSEDGQRFEAVAWVDGNGTTSQISRYTLEHQPTAVASFYRLVQVDFNGAATGFAPLKVARKPKSGTTTLFPNPAQRGRQITLNIDAVASAGTYQVINVSGQRVLSGSLTGTANGALNASVPTADLSPGMYMMVITTDQATTSHRFVVR